MCKLFAISETKDIPTKKLEAILLKTRDVMKYQSDGFGFAMADRPNEPYQHRYVEPSLFQGFRKPQGLIADLLADDAYSITGTLPDAPHGALIAHGRNATNDINLANTHPFIRNGWTMAHNGIVHRKPDKEEIPRNGTNDSEHLLNVFTTYGADKIAEYLTGMIALVAIAPDGSLVMLKDNRTNLYMAEFTIKKINRLVIGTSKELINAVSKILNVRLRPIALPCFRLIHVDGNAISSADIPAWEARSTSIFFDWEQEGTKAALLAEHAPRTFPRTAYTSEQWAALQAGEVERMKGLPHASADPFFYSENPTPDTDGNLWPEDEAEATELAPTIEEAEQAAEQI